MSADQGIERSAAELILPSELPLNGLTFENSYKTHPKCTFEGLQARMDLGDYVISIVSSQEMPEIQQRAFPGRIVSRILQAARPSQRVSQDVLEVIEGERAICHGTAELGPLTEAELADCFGGLKTGRGVAIFFRNHAAARHENDWNWLT